MMTTMRENMPLIMWILVGAFLATIVFSWGMGGFKTGSSLDGVVGRVGDREILYENYNRRVQDAVAREREQDTTNKQITDAQIRQFRKEVWDDMVRQELMNEFQQQLGIVTSDAEVAYAVRNNPPVWIRQNENFLTNGQFDLSKYEQFLRDPQSADILVAIENDYRTSMANQKVIDRVLAAVYVTDQEAWDEYVASTQKFQAAAVSFPVRNFTVDTNSINSSEIQQYYQDHKSEYERKERRKLAYVTFPVTATKDDSDQVVETAREAMDRAKAGEDFAALTEEFSEDEGSAVKGGDLGYFGHGRMVKEFDSTAWAAPVGEVVGPVVTRFGVHIVKVIERAGTADTDSVRASHILVKWKVTPDTEERVSQAAKDFQETAKSKGFDQAAQQFSLQASETDWFPHSNTGNIPGLGSLMPAMDFAFGSKKGSVSYVYKTMARGQDSYAVFIVRDVQAPGVAPLTEVESQIKTALVRKRQEDLALEAARKFRNGISNGGDFWAKAGREGLKVDTTGEHTQRDFMRVFGQDENIAKAMFKLNPGQVSDALSNVRGAYVAVLMSKTAADSTEFQAKKAEYVDRLRRVKQNSVYADWLTYAKDKVGVEDLRYLYYTDY